MSDKSYISVDNMTFYRGERVIFERLNSISNEEKLLPYSVLQVLAKPHFLS
ncbi:hypothetical protein JCM19233_5276 [Vibrio astriarenae]|nr:hypothetical protein JCM19233_5276 [Vibrio sp. C7]